MLHYATPLKMAGVLSLAFVLAGCASRSVQQEEPDPSKCWNDKCLAGQMARIVSQVRDSEGRYDIGFQAAAIEMIRRADPEAHEVVNAYLQNETSPVRMQNLLELYMQSDDHVREQISAIINSRDTRPETLQALDRQAARSLDMQCDVVESRAESGTSASSLNINCRSASASP